MRSAGNFHPEWGYLAPAPSFVRTLRIALVATAIGATAGAAVVVSLMARPASRTADSSIAAHALVTPVPVVNAAPAAAASAAAAPAPAPVQPGSLPVQSSVPAPAPAAALAPPPAGAAPQPAAALGGIAAASPNPANAAPPPQLVNAPNVAVGVAPAHTAHIEEPAAAPLHEDPAVTADGGENKKPAVKRHHVAGYEAVRRWQSKKPHHQRGFGPLFRLFSFRGAPFSAN
jgi:hypothetical protein